MNRMNRMTIPALLVTVVLVLAAFIAIGTLPNNAQADGYTSKNWQEHQLVNPTPITTTVTAATTTPVTGLRYGEVEVHASMSNGDPVPTASTLDYTVQFSNDGQNWADAAGVDLVSGTPVPYVLEGSLTGGAPNGYQRVPMSGKYVRVEWDSTGNITPSISLLLKNTGGQ